MENDILTREILLKSGFTDAATSEATRSCGVEYWYLGEGCFISNENLLITMFDNRGFSIRYCSSVAYGLRTISELRMALKLFKCDHLVNLVLPNND